MSPSVLAVRMNSDLARGEELLKKTGSGNLFMIFGEPDLDIEKQKDGTAGLLDRLADAATSQPTTALLRGYIIGLLEPPTLPRPIAFANSSTA